MIQLSKVESLKILQLWNDYEQYLDGILVQMLKDYESQLSSKNTEWETTRQQVEYLARKQTLVDIKKILSNRYE